MATDPHAPLRSLLGTFLWDTIEDAPASAPKMGPKHAYIRFVNQRTERLLRAFKAAAREHVRQLPGRAQKGAVDAALRSVTPKIGKALRA